MTQHPHLDPSSFVLDGGSAGIMLIHGFTGAPTEMRLLGSYLNAAGMTVSAPLLPGHGATIEKMNRAKWTDWVDHVEEGYRDLSRRCERVFVGGLSMGSLLALHHAARHPELSGVIAYSPATWVRNQLLPYSTIARYFIASRPKDGISDLVDLACESQLWCYEEHPVPAAAQLYRLMGQVRRELAHLVPPLLIVYSTGDRAIDPTSAQRTYDLAGSRDKEIVKIEQSGHVITVDRQWQYVAGQTLDWVRRHGG